MHNNYLEIKYLAVCMMYAEHKNKNKKYVLDMVQSEFNLQDDQMEIISKIFDLLLIIAIDLGTDNYLDLLSLIILYLKSG